MIGVPGPLRRYTTERAWLTIATRCLAGSSGRIVTGMAVNKAISLVKVAVLASVFGVSAELDRFLLAATLPFLLGDLLGDAAYAVVLPAYHRAQGSTRPEVGSVLWSRLFAAGLWLTAPFAILVGFWAARTPAPDALGPTLTWMVSWLLLYIPVVFFCGGVSALLQARDVYLAPFLRYGLTDLLVVLAILWKPSPTWLVWGTIVGLCAQLLLLVVLSYRHSLLRIGVHRGDVQWKWIAPTGRLVWQMQPWLVSGIVLQVNVVVDRFIASRIGTGVVSTLTYAASVAMLLMIMAPVISTAMFSRFSETLEMGGPQVARPLLDRAGHALVLFLIPATVFVALYRGSVTEVLLGRGSFDDSGVALTASTLLMYVLGVLPACAVAVYHRIYQAQRRAQEPMLVGMAVAVLNIVLDYILGFRWGAGGIALGTSLLWGVSAVLLDWRLRSNRLHLLTRRVAVNAVRVTLAAVGAASVTSVLFGVSGASTMELGAAGLLMHGFVFGFLYLVGLWCVPVIRSTGAFRDAPVPGNGSKVD